MDVVVIDTAHGHSVHRWPSVVERIKRESEPGLQVIAGNVATYDATQAP